MSGISLEINGMFPWSGSIGGLIGFPYQIARVDIVQNTYKAVEVGFNTDEEVRLSVTKYEEESVGAHKYNIVSKDEEHRIEADKGTYVINIFEETNTQVYLVDDENVIEV